MATQSQIAANRRNAQKSTGLRTAEGKAAVAKNATKHGLFGRSNVVISEKQADFDALRDDMLAELAPAGTMESVLAERIVSLTWRLQRAERMQNEIIDAKIRREINLTYPKLSKTLVTGKPCDNSMYSDKCYDDVALGYVAMVDFADQRALERLSLYERRFEASLYRTMAEFKKLRKERKAKEAEDIEKALKKAPEPVFGEPLKKQSQLTSYCVRRDAYRENEFAKQSQSMAAQNDLSSFKKREYELLLGASPAPNKANGLHQKTEIRGKSAAQRHRRETLICRY